MAHTLVQKTRHRSKPPEQRLKRPVLANPASIQQVLSAVMDAVITIDAAEQILFFNTAAERIFQRPAAEVIGHPLDLLIPVRDRETHHHHISRFGETGTHTRRMGALQTVYGLLPDGSEFPLEASISQTIVNGQKLFTVILRDLSERQAMLSRIHYQANLLDQVSDAVISTDLEFNITDWNQGAQAIYGWSANEVIGKPLGMLVHPIYSVETRQEVIRHFMEQGHWEGELVHHRRDGTPLNILTAVVLVRDVLGNPLGASAVNRDITARKRAEDAVRQLNVELEERIRGRTNDLESANARLENELAIRKRREQDLALRLQITDMLANASALEEVAPGLLQALGETLGWQLGELYLLDPATLEVKTESYWHTPNALLQEFAAQNAELFFPTTTGIPRAVIHSRQPVWLDDATVDSRVVRASMLRRAGLHGGVAFPIQIAQATCGMVFFYSWAVRPRDEEQLQLLNEIGSELGQFIIRTRSQAMLKRAQDDLAHQVETLQTTLNKMNALYDISQNLLLEFGLPDLLQSIADTLMSTLPADRVSLIILDVEHSRIEHFIKSGPGADKIIAVSFEELWEGLTGWALRERQPALSPQAVPDPRASPQSQARRMETGCGAILVVPLIYQEKLLGTITAMNRPEERDFGGADMALMQAITNQAAAAIEHKRGQERLRYQNEFLSQLNSITFDLLNSKELDELLDAIILAATRLLNTAYGHILLVEGDDLVVVAEKGNQPFLRGVRISRPKARLSWQAFDTRQPAVLEDYSVWEHRLDVYDNEPMYAVADFPILIGDRAIGVLGLGRSMPSFIFDAEQIRYGTMFAQLVAVVLENLRLRESLREQAFRDPLTGLYNRRYMREWLVGELQRAARYYSPTSIMLLDIDHFKLFNDTYGHAAGDFVLREVGGMLNQLLRGGDIACRYGGEEFLMILPGLPPATALRRAEQLRSQIEGMNPVYRETALPAVTVSIGVAIVPQNDPDGNAGILAADAALYRAKAQGRNCVVLQNNFD